MFVIFLLTAVSALNVTDFKNEQVLRKSASQLLVTQFHNFLIDFQPNHTEYLMFQGDYDYVYLHSKGRECVLWLLQNDSHEIYTAPYNAEKLIFGWINFTINNIP